MSDEVYHSGRGFNYTDLGNDTDCAPFQHVSQSGDFFGILRAYAGAVVGVTWETVTAPPTQEQILAAEMGSHPVDSTSRPPRTQYNRSESEGAFLQIAGWGSLGVAALGLMIMFREWAWRTGTTPEELVDMLANFLKGQ